MKPRVIFTLCAIIVIANSCSTPDNVSDLETIPFNKFQVMSYDDISEDLFRNMEYTVLKAESTDYMFTHADKIVYKNNTFYILDWVIPRTHKIIAFDKKGNPVLSLNKQGSGPGEYLQISDFDIDDTKDLWIMDGQSDHLLHYSDECRFINSKKLPFEVSTIKFINGDMLFFVLSKWNMSDHKNEQILLSDTAFNIRKSMLNYDKSEDYSYAFSSFGFTELDGSVLYHQPISDTVYKISNKGELIKSYYFDFGSRTVTDEIRKDLELHYDELENFSFLAKSVYIDESVIIGSVYQGRYKDFIIDRKQGILYLQNEDYKGLSFMGVADENIIYLLRPGNQTFMDNLPEDILSNMENGNEVPALVSIGSLFQ